MREKKEREKYDETLPSHFSGRAWNTAMELCGSTLTNEMDEILTPYFMLSPNNQRSLDNMIEFSDRTGRFQKYCAIWTIK